MDDETKARYLLLLEESLLNVATDVPELVNHLGAQFSEILALSDLDGAVIKSGVILDQRNMALQNLGVAHRLSEKTLMDLAQGAETEWIVLCAMECQRLVKRVAGWCLGVELGNTKAEISARSDAARKAADVLHNRPGGNREKSTAIRAAWATGIFTSRTRCAEEECAGLGMSYDAARKALRNTPAPIRNGKKKA